MSATTKQCWTLMPYPFQYDVITVTKACKMFVISPTRSTGIHAIARKSHPDRPPQTRAACQHYLTRIVNAILTDAGRGSQSLRNSRPPGIRELDGKTVLVRLRWIGCHQAGEALTCRVNNV